jgi:cytochrome c-type biogenesis protein CcmH/NrfG
MSKSVNESGSSDIIWRPVQVIVMSLVCLVIGLAVGYLVKGSAPAPVVAASTSVPSPASAPPPTAMPSPAAMPPHGSMMAGGTAQPMPTLEQMKAMADKQAAPLLEKLKTDPKNAALLNDVGKMYRATHQFKQAAVYYQKSLDIDPKNVGARTDLASCLYYEGDVDGALAQLQKSLTYDPKHAGTLLNIGMIKWQGKHDADGAIQAWQKLLKLNPNFPQKAAVEHMIAEAKKSKV